MVSGGTLGTGSLSGGGPSVAFTEPRVPLVLTFLSVRPVTGPGVEQAVMATAKRAMIIHDLDMKLGFIC